MGVAWGSHLTIAIASRFYTSNVESQSQHHPSAHSRYSSALIHSRAARAVPDRLIASWHDPSARGRIVFFHHPPYVTEATKWLQGQTLAVRHHLRTMLDAVQAEVGELAQGQTLLSLVLCGHAHCLEYLRTGDTGHGDAHIPWIICGGSGYSLRRQRTQGNVLTEKVDGHERVVATSELFLGRTGKGSTLKRPYTALRIEVSDGTPLQLSVMPLVTEQGSEGRKSYTHEPLTIESNATASNTAHP